MRFFGHAPRKSGCGKRQSRFGLITRHPVPRPERPAPNPSHGPTTFFISPILHNLPTFFRASGSPTLHPEFGPGSPLSNGKSTSARRSRSAKIQFEPSALALPGRPPAAAAEPHKVRPQNPFACYGIHLLKRAQTRRHRRIHVHPGRKSRRVLRPPQRVL